MELSEDRGEPPRLTEEERTLLVLDLIKQVQATYEPGHDRIITPDNVYQPARPVGRDVMESFMGRLMLPGSGVEGLENLDHCLAEIQAGRSVIFLPEHRGNFDVPSFNHLLRRDDPRYAEVLKRLIYIAGRKLNESSDLVKMFSEKYSRLVIVPRREFPRVHPGESEAEISERKVVEQTAARINRAAFRQMIKLKKAGHIFVLYPLGGRLKPGADNVPVRETASYLSGFDTAYPISMEGNTLPPEERMEDERPIYDKVVFRVGAPVDCKPFLAAEKKRFGEAQAAGRLADGMDCEQFTVGRIMEMLETLRLTGDWANSPAP